MTRCIAFLRAVNVGGRFIKMEALVAAFEGVGLASVQTFIARGNVIFEARACHLEALERKIEAHLHATFGFEVHTFIRTEADRFQLHERELHWISRDKQSDTTFSNAAFERTLMIRTTFRSITTLRRLIEKLGQTSPCGNEH